MMPEFLIFGISIPSFFVVISLSLSFLVIYLSQRIDHMNKDPRVAYDMALILMISGFLGGRLMHVFYEEWPYYTKYPMHVLYFWQGGYVFYGGFIACAVSTYVYCKVKAVRFLEMADFFSPILSLAHAFGRLGCFFAGCCYGAKCVLPWALEGRHPTALYLLFGELFIYVYLLVFETQIQKLKRRDLVGAVFVKWILLHSLMRLLVEYYRDDFRGAFFNLPLFGHLSVSQLISLVLALISLGYFILKLRSGLATKKKPL